MKGLGTNEDRLIKEIVTHSNSQRQLIKQQYLTMYGKTLEEHIESEISGIIFFFQFMSDFLFVLKLVNLKR
jgi:hypothetical protein